MSYSTRPNNLVQPADTLCHGAAWPHRLTTHFLRSHNQKKLRHIHCFTRPDDQKNLLHIVSRGQMTKKKLRHFVTRGRMATQIYDNYNTLYHPAAWIHKHATIRVLGLHDDYTKIIQSNGIDSLRAEVSRARLLRSTGRIWPAGRSLGVAVFLWGKGCNKQWSKYSPLATVKR